MYQILATKGEETSVQCLGMFQDFQEWNLRRLMPLNDTVPFEDATGMQGNSNTRKRYLQIPLCAVQSLPYRVLQLHTTRSCRLLNLPFRYRSVPFQWGPGFQSSVHRYLWVKRQPRNANPLPVGWNPPRKDWHVSWRPPACSPLPIIKHLHSFRKVLY